MRAANEVNLRMAPLTPDHHFYIDQGANAHVRLVLIAIGKKLVATGHARPAADDVMFLRYNELRALIGDPSGIRRARDLIAAAKAERERGVRVPAARWVGTATQSQLDFPYLVNWGFPEKFHRKPGRRSRARSRASAARRAWSRASPGSCCARTSSTRSAPATSWSAT